MNANKKPIRKLQTLGPSVVVAAMLLFLLEGKSNALISCSAFFLAILSLIFVNVCYFELFKTAREIIDKIKNKTQDIHNLI